MRETEPSKRPLTPAEQALDAQMNDHLDQKIVRNFAVANRDSEHNPSESVGEAIRTVATRIFSLDPEKTSEYANNMYAPAVAQQKEDLNRLDRQFTRYLDRKIVRNFATGTPEGRKEATRTVATRIFSLDEHKTAAAANTYTGAVEQQRQALSKKPNGNA